jgi:hypothetical protein
VAHGWYQIEERSQDYVEEKHTMFCDVYLPGNTKLENRPQEENDIEETRKDHQTAVEGGSPPHSTQSHGRLGPV